MTHTDAATDTVATPQHHQKPDREQALSFGKAVADYERGRPAYPAEVARWILSHVEADSAESIRAVDVGAGTGKFTRALDATPIHVTAVEPVPEMRAQLERNMPSVTVQEGFAEATGLADGYADLVTFAQSWHWVDIEPACREIARILRPGGVLALVWNVRDESVDWLARLSEIIGASPAEEYDSLSPSVAPPFQLSDYAEFSWSTILTRDELLAMVTSRSYIITMAEDERDAVLVRLGDLLDTHPDLAGTEEFTVPYITRVTIAAPAA